MFIFEDGKDYVVAFNLDEAKEIGSDIIEWCKENIKKEWRYRNYISGTGALYPYEIYINDKSEAMLFKLRWF
jgi:hypothetical protein